MEPANYQPPVYAQGCLSAGWADLKASPDYVKRLLLLGLIMCVPVLNFVVAGYLLLWAREVPFGGRTPLPQKMVTGQTFEYGFYAFVLSLIGAIVGGIVGGILGFIPILGGLLGLAVTLAVSVAVMLMQMRMIMAMNLGAAFDVKDLWEKGKRKGGELLLVTLVPSIVMGVIIAVLSFVVMMPCIMLGIGGAMPAMAGMSSVAEPTFGQAMALLGAMGGPLVIGVLVIYVVACIGEVIASALSYRALGHWVGRYASDWTTLSVPKPPLYPTYTTQPPTPGSFQ